MSNRRLRIALVSDDFTPARTGAGVYVEGLATDLSERGHDVWVFTTRASERKPHAQNVRIISGPTLRLFGIDQAFMTPRTLRHFFEKERIDLVHHHFLSALTDAASRAAATLDIPQIYTHHMSVELLYQHGPLRPMKPVFLSLYRSFLRRMTWVIAPSLSAKRTLELEQLRSPVLHLPNPVLFPRGTNTENRIPNNEQFSVLYAGRLAPEKNVPLLLEGFADLLARCPNAFLFIAGTGPLASTLTRKAEALGIAHRVEFLGHVDKEQLATLYRRCHVLVLPSRSEVQPLSVLEAMSFGMPVVLSREIYSPEILRDGENCTVFDPERGNLRAALEHLWREPETRERLGVSARAAVASLTPSAIFARIRTVYGEVLAQSRHETYARSETPMLGHGAM